MKKILMVVFVVSLLVTAPLIVERFSVEQANDTYQVVVPESQLNGFERWGIDEEGLVNGLKQAGVHAISVEPETIQSLEDQLELLYVNKPDFLREHPDAVAEYRDKSGFFIAPVEGSEDIFQQVQSALGDAIEGTMQTNDVGHPYFFVQGGEWLTEKPITFNMDRIDQLKQSEFGIVLRMSNDIDENNDYLLDQMVTIQEEYAADQVIFLGEKALGMPLEEPVYNGENEEKRLEEFTDFFKENGFKVAQIEFFEQEGLQSYGFALGNRILRLHSLNLYDNRSPESYVERASRAVKERNMRLLFVNIFDEGKLESGSFKPDSMLQNSVNTIAAIHEAIPNQFEHGKAQPFSEITQPLWAKLAVAVAIAALTGLALLNVSRRLAYVGMASMLVVGLLWTVVDIGLIGKALALFVGILAPAMAVGQALHVKSKADLLKKYVLAGALSLAGSWLIVVILYGNEFLVKVDEFRGVKLLYVGSIVLLTVYLIYKNKTWLGYLREPVRYYQVAIIGVLLAAFAYFLMRSGNDATVSGIELQFRTALEQLLYVRPRTKEFLIGFPVFVFAMYHVMKGRNMAVVLYLGAVIGTMSLVNTFTHLHIPLSISLLRSIYGLIIGLIIGLLLIVVWKGLVRLYHRFIRPRWS
ncbi:hypothetical protein G4V62_08265 [Bacillaceae bacterium SIJ1]|uniref:DUF5693 family protein n=1 Tax=Litoribacterium kuwaitense TaxID=1398745 RepID=UPI0013EBCE8F|nr:DUF5693 family protein [Litoribacterium kuwaitense]NGP44953.1 hypothetical protein [Litoribacterium kuwaitense]